MWWPVLLALLAPPALAQPHPERELDAQWELWKKTHRKQYSGQVRGGEGGAGAWDPRGRPQGRMLGHEAVPKVGGGHRRDPRPSAVSLPLLPPRCRRTR